MNYGTIVVLITIQSYVPSPTHCALGLRTHKFYIVFLLSYSFLQLTKISELTISVEK